MSYLYNEDTIDEVRDKSDIVDVISQYVSLRQFGSNYKGLCPFHNEKTPSFTVSEEKQIFHCFGCGEGGDVFSFLMKYENLEFTEALKQLADKAHVKLEKKQSTQRDELRDRLYTINRQAGIFFYKTMFKSKRAVDYLKARSLDIDTLKTFGIGYAPDSWNSLLNFLKEKGFSESDIEKTGLISKSRKTNRYYDKFRDRIIFPIIDTRGKLIGFGGRSLDEKNQPKYLNSPESPVFSKGNHLYGLNIVKKHNKTDKIILVEGYMDVLALFKFGIVNSVASLGTALTQNQVRLLKRYRDDIYICYDSDNAGKKATNKAIDVMKTLDISPKIIMLPENLDPDDFIKSFGVDRFKEEIENALSAIDFKITEKKKQYDMSRHEEKISFIKDVSVFLREIKSPVELEVYLDKLSKETGIPLDALRKEVSGDSVKKESNVEMSQKRDYSYKYSKTKKFDLRRENITPVEFKLKPGHVTAERELLSLILNNRSIYESVRECLSPKDLLTEIHQSILGVVYELYEESIDIDECVISDKFSDDERETLREILLMKVTDDSEGIVEDYIKNIRYYKINLKREQLKTEISKLDSKRDKTREEIEKLNALCLELIKIDQSTKIN